MLSDSPCQTCTLLAIQVYTGTTARLTVMIRVLLSSQIPSEMLVRAAVLYILGTVLVGMQIDRINLFMNEVLNDTHYILRQDSYDPVNLTNSSQVM